MQQLGMQFVARSGMEEASSSGILVGRPFGGVSITWSPDLNHLITPLSDFRHKRVVGAELKTVDLNVLLLCIYMPYFNPSRRAECITETIDSISMLETIIDQHPNHNVIIGGDFNMELNGTSPFGQMWKDFSTKRGLSFCNSFFPSNTVTYHHKSLNQKKWIDHFLVSPSLIKNNLSNFDVLDDGDNLSDHFPILMKMKIKCSAARETTNKAAADKKLCWNKLNSSLIDQYTSRVRELVDLLPRWETSFACSATCICDNSRCHEAIQQEYNNLVHILLTADSALPRQKNGMSKDWWNDELNELKKKSIEIHEAWKNSGQPRQGPLYDERLRVRAKYKSALRSAQREPKQTSWDRLHSALSDSDTNTFWKSWRTLYNKNKCDLPPVVNGISSHVGIAESFKHSFKKNSTPNNSERVDSLNKRFEKEFSEYKDRHILSCDCKKNNVSVIDIIDALLSMKGGKSSDADGISVEHLHNAPLNFLCRISSLFNAMLNHAFVPRQFQLGLMLPLVKDQQGNRSDIDNYRGITISPIISKVLEHVLKNTYCDYLSTSEYQFGFKKNSSTVHAVHCLRETVTYFVNNDSRVFCSFLDASKAFDRLVHSGLFIKLINRNVPLQFLLIIISWYSNLLCRVKWGNAYSDWFSITAGVRQGGILSPDFYSIYVDDLLIALIKSGKGCHHLGKFAAALFYADDMAILSPSLHGLDALLQICGNYCEEWDICLNAKKTKNLYFGKRVDMNYDIVLNGVTIQWVQEWVYLGVHLKSSKTFDCSVQERVKKFYRCANAIFRIEGKSNDTVMLRLVESHCVPILTYAIEVLHVSNRDERRQLRVAYNSLFRKIFGYRWSESVTALQNFLGRSTWEQLAEKRRESFIKRVQHSDSCSLSRQLLPSAQS